MSLTAGSNLTGTGSTAMTCAGFCGKFSVLPVEKQIITVLLNRSTQHAQIPGSLAQSQVEANPKQANTGNLDKQAGRNQN